jgi:hypothetical protein
MLNLSVYHLAIGCEMYQLITSLSGVKVSIFYPVIRCEILSWFYLVIDGKVIGFFRSFSHLILPSDGNSLLMQLRVFSLERLKHKFMLIYAYYKNYNIRIVTYLGVYDSLMGMDW